MPDNLCVVHSHATFRSITIKRTNLSPRLIPFYLAYLNKRHAKRREELGKSAAIVDESMIAKEKMGDSKAVELENASAPQHRALEEDNALHDVTDLLNEDFIYVY